MVIWFSYIGYLLRASYQCDVVIKLAAKERVNMFTVSLSSLLLPIDGKHLCSTVQTQYARQQNASWKKWTFYSYDPETIIHAAF